MLFVRVSQSGILSDVIFKVGTEIFQAHKQILVGRSPVFCAMLQAGGIEATTGDITVEDIEPVAFKQAAATTMCCSTETDGPRRQVLRFIYTDECEDGAMEAMADHLLVAAMRYQLGRLQVMSEIHLVKTLTVSARETLPH